MATTEELINLALAETRKLVDAQAAGPETAYKLHALVKAIHMASADLNEHTTRVLLLSHGIETPGKPPTAMMHTALVGLSAMRMVYEEMQAQLVKEQAH